MSDALQSPDNPLVKHLVRLHQARHRREEKHFLVEGRRAIDAFLTAGHRAQVLLARTGEEIPGHWPKDEIREMSDRVAQKVSQAVSASGFIATFAMSTPPPLRPAEGGLVLAGIADPGNLGTLLRSAVAFGIRQIVVLGGADPYAGKVVQASAGALALVELHVWPEADGLAGVRGGAPLCALVVEGGADPATLPAGPRWLVVGSEAQGIPAAWLPECAERVTLAMPGEVESLNAAVAGSIACYLLARRS